MQMDEPVLRVMERMTNGDAPVLTIQGELDIATVARSGLAWRCCELDVTVDLRRVSSSTAWA